MVRSRKLKDCKDIEALDGVSCDIFYPSWVDSYYPNRPDELKHMHLYDFLTWHDWEQKEPSKSFQILSIHGWLSEGEITTLSAQSLQVQCQ